jgi:hypothetical protein
LLFEGYLAPPKIIKKQSKTLRVYSYFPLLRGHRKPSETIKNPQSIQVFLFF